MIFPSSQCIGNDRKKKGTFVEDLCQLVELIGLDNQFVGRVWIVSRGVFCKVVANLGIEPRTQ